MNCFFYRIITISSLLICTINASFSQSHYVNPEVFSEINGLPNNEVRCLLKDSKGYLWVGTIYGLAKYDGNKFSVFKHQSNRNSISGDVISTIYEDNSGNILVGANGLSVLDRKAGTWKNYLHDPNRQNSISNPLVSSIAQENDSIYWIITGNGINRFNIGTGEFKLMNFQLSSRIFFSKIHSIEPNESILFSISSSFYRYNLLDDSFESYHMPQGYTNVTLFNGQVIGIKTQNANRNAVILYDLDSNSERILVGDIASNAGLFCNQSNLFVVHSNRIIQLDSALNHSKTITYQQNLGNLGIEFNDIVNEENGTAWLATNNGLLKFLPDSPFQFIDSKSGLPNDYIRSLSVDCNNNLWIGVRQGAAFRIASIDNLPKNVNPSVEQINFPTPNGEVFATNQILELKNGNLLFVTSSILFHYNIKTRRFTDQLEIPGNNQFFSAVETEHGILVGSLERPTLFRIYVVAGRILMDTTFVVDSMPALVNTLYRDTEGDLWLGGEGFYSIHFSEDFKKVSLMNHIPNISIDNYSNNSVWDILDIGNNQLFVSTTTNGFYLFSKDSDSYTHFSKTNGLSSDFTCSVLKDYNQNIWISTKEGVSFLNLNDSSVQNYPVKNGQLNTDFTFKCGAVSNGNLMMFGSKQGIVCFYPERIGPTEVHSPLFVNEFRIFDVVARRELTQGDTIKLNHNENFFSFEFSLLDFRMPQEVSYSFQLLNYDRVPRTPANSYNSVSYTDVPPGKYRFTLTAGSSGFTNQQTIQIYLFIKPAFYQTLWFKVLGYIIALLVLAIVAFSVVRRQILRARLQKMELHLLRSQIDPHFIFNTLTSIQHTILTSPKNESIEALSRFSRLMRMGLDYSRMEIITLDKAIQFYETFVAVHSLNLDEKIDFHVSVHESISAEKIKLSPMLLQPFIENAIVHGLTPKNRDMRIDLEIVPTNGWLECIVRDNGVGRKKAAEIGQKKEKGHQSVGIEISRKSILKQLKKGRFIKESFRIEDNYDENGNPAGTTVYLKIPYQH